MRCCRGRREPPGRVLTERSPVSDDNLRKAQEKLKEEVGDKTVDDLIAEDPKRED